MKERFDRLLKEVQQISSEVCCRDLHTVQPVLVEEKNSHMDGYVTGRMGNNTLVHFPGMNPSSAPSWTYTWRNARAFTIWAVRRFKRQWQNYHQ